MLDKPENSAHCKCSRIFLSFIYSLGPSKPQEILLVEFLTDSFLVHIRKQKSYK